MSRLCYDTNIPRENKKTKRKYSSEEDLTMKKNFLTTVLDALSEYYQSFAHHV